MNLIVEEDQNQYTLIRPPALFCNAYLYIFRCRTISESICLKTPVFPAQISLVMTFRLILRLSMVQLGCSFSPIWLKTRRKDVLPPTPRRGGFRGTRQNGGQCTVSVGTPSLPATRPKVGSQRVFILILCRR